MAINLRTVREVEALRAAANRLWDILLELSEVCSPGLTTVEIDALAHQMIQSIDAEPIFAGYRTATGSTPFPGAACISVNEEVVHAVPSSRILRDGDLVSIDLGIRIDGWCADSAIAIIIGTPSVRATVLLDATRACLKAGIESIAPGIPWSMVATRMELVASLAGFSLVQGLSGHGIGRHLHEPPQAPAVMGDRPDFILRPGMVLTVEPILIEGSGRVLTLDDGWTVISEDRGWSCQEERMVAVTASGASVLGIDEDSGHCGADSGGGTA